MKLTPLRTIALGALSALIAASAFALISRPAEAQRNAGPWMLVHHSNETANVGIFRINTSTGATSFCYVVGVGEVKCSAEVQ